MAIVEMTKLKLCALSNQKSEILEALSKTRAVEVVDTEEVADTFLLENNLPLDLEEKSVKVNKAIDFINATLGQIKTESYYSLDDKELNSDIILSYDEFNSIKQKEASLLEYADKLIKYESSLIDSKSTKAKLVNGYNQLLPFEAVEGNFSDYKDTEKTKIYLGQMKKEGVETLRSLEDCPVMVSTLSSGDLPVVVVACLKEDNDKVYVKLNESGFIKCPYTDKNSPKAMLLKLQTEIESVSKNDADIMRAVYDEATLIKELKVLSDYYKLAIEKNNDNEKFRYTSRTFILEGYLPTEKTEEVKTAIESVTDAVIIEYSKPTKNDTPPTLCKNNKLIKQAEFITDLYSTPDYREFDPNGFVFFFYMMFMGVIMADIGYGVLMIALGLVLSSKIKVETGAKKLWNVIAISGAFTILWGVLFNSCFGYQLPFYKAILPSPLDASGNIAINDLKAILLLCLLMGVIHMSAGYVCKAINFFRTGDIFGGIAEGISWVVFFVGAVFAAFNFITDYLIPGYMGAEVVAFFDKMTMPGIYMAAGGLIFAAVTAGRNERILGKFTKAFSSVYGLINLMSDILSYARLFGLMLSGMMITNTFKMLSEQMFNMNNAVGLIAGVLIFAVGHAFNLAMGVLGAYIHDSRLQYIEFFGKFYTGEGRKFQPLGSKFDYIYLNNKMKI